MKKSIFSPVLLVLVLMATSVKAQMGIGTATPNAAAQLDVSSTTKGFLAPRMTKTERDAITTVTSASKGLLIYQTDNTPGFYYYDGTAWFALSSSGTAGVDLTTDQSVDGLKTFTSIDGLQAIGTYGSGTASALGAGTRMMWYPKKAAFRAGFVNGTQWDDANIGNGSTAFGTVVMASARSSTAIGSENTASGDYSTALGERSIASGLNSIAIGSQNTASGNGSTAIGSQNTASANGSTAMGKQNTASSNGSTAMGINTTASGITSTAMGESTTASGTISTAMGRGSQASGDYSTSMGERTYSRSYGETAIGFYNTDYTPISPYNFDATDRLFVIGNGTSSVNSNALVMLKNGNTTFGGSLAVNGNGAGTSYTLPTGRGTANYVLTTDGSGGTSWAAAASGVDLTTAQSVGGLKTFTSVDGLLATGTFGTGAASSLGSGTRMMWYPKKAAFRAGASGGTAWNDANIGDYSTAMGVGTIASENSSTAMGNTTTASGLFSTAMGLEGIASGAVSTAFGNVTTASGDNSTSMGDNTTASGINSTAMGSFSIASGSGSTAMGYNTRANGNFSNTMGNGTISTGVASLAIGDNTNAKSYAETVIGTYNTNYTPTSTSSFTSTDRLFVIGNGTNAARSNALEMLKNGNTTFGGSLAVNGNGTGTSYTLPTGRGTANYVLTTDGSGGTTWTAASGGTAGVDLTTAQSVGGLKTFTSNDGLLATGTFGTGATSSLGAGTRMMWYPKKAAFRAGYIDGTQWDDANIGNYSTAMGYGTTASGEYSTSMGYGTIASGILSTTMGFVTTASGSHSVATGDNTTASGDNSTTMGSNSIASGNNSIAMGGFSRAIAANSTAMGYNTRANSFASTTMGIGTASSGEASIAMGNSTTAKSFAETVIGTFNTDYTATSTSSFNATDRLFVIGNGTNAARSNALVMLKNGNTAFSGTVTGVSFTSTSDKRLKKNIVPLKNSIETIMKLKPVSYEKKNSLSSSDYSVKENGFIAQELQKVMPSLVVVGTDKDKLLSVNYTAIIPVLTKAIQEQQNAIQDQKKENQEQKKAIQEQKKAIQDQQNQIAELKKMVEQLMKK